MQGYIGNIESETKDNDNFRKVLYTSKSSQLVVMSLKPGEDIGEEIHDLDQFIRIEAGSGIAYMDEDENQVKDDWAFVVPAGMKHNLKNTGDSDLKLYTIYSPPEHIDGTVHATKAEAEADEDDHFDGQTSE